MSTELQRDIELVAWEICHESEAWPALQRIRARLAPDRERVARGMFEAEMRRRGAEFDWDRSSPMIKNGWYEVANDAIAAMGETP